jgi:hypothetical protein
MFIPKFRRVELLHNPAKVTEEYFSECHSPSASSAAETNGAKLVAVLVEVTPSIFDLGLISIND